MEMKNKKVLIIHCGYPKAGSSFIIDNMIKISIDNNTINVNNEANLLNCFELIKNLSNKDFNKKNIFITNLISSYIKRDFNFFGYERILNINDDYNNKIRFFNRIKKIAKDINVELKISIFIRNQIDLITSQYKENYLRIIFKNLKFISFRNYISTIINGSNVNLIKNLDFEDNLRRVYQLFPKKNIYIGTLEELSINSDEIFQELLEFCNFTEYDLNSISLEAINSSSNKEILKLIKVRIYDYLFMKKYFTFTTVLNSMELFFRLTFLQSLLNKYVKISESEQREIYDLYRLANQKLMRRFTAKTKNIEKKYFNNN
tara:strand:- start:114 stop:1064 length:951 start_codon:yes stop_codon:yes gene_type:complete